jgi:hypothetical protein
VDGLLADGLPHIERQTFIVLTERLYKTLINDGVFGANLLLYGENFCFSIKILLIKQRLQVTDQLDGKTGLKTSKVTFIPILVKTLLQTLRLLVHGHHELTVIIDGPKRSFIFEGLVNT